MFDTSSYPLHLTAKLAELRDFVENNLAAAAHNQKCTYDQHTLMPTYSVGDLVWLSVPTAGKLDPKWEGRWVVKSVKNPVSIEITNKETTKLCMLIGYTTDLCQAVSHLKDPLKDLHQVLTDQCNSGHPLQLTTCIFHLPLRLCTHATRHDIAIHRIDMDGEARDELQSGEGECSGLLNFV